MLTQDYLKELFDYKDGNLYWIKNRPHVTVGMIAGHLRKQDGYTRIAIDKKQYYAHKLIFLYHYGVMPKILDHIDGNRSNNNIKNLRIATNSQNGANRCIGKNSTTKLKGVHKIKENKYRAYISINKKIKHLGYFSCPNIAHEAYQVAAKSIFNEFAKFN